MTTIFNDSNIRTELIIFAILLALICFFMIVLQRLITSAAKHFVIKFNSNYLEILEQFSFFRYLYHGCFSLYLLFCGNLLRLNEVFAPFFYNIYNIILALYTAFSIGLLLIATTNIGSNIYATTALRQSIPIHLHAQILKIFIAAVALIVVISYAFHIPLISLVTSLGAAAALLTFIFKNTFEGLIASLQLTLQEIIYVGDFVTIPAYKITGKIEEISITVVKIKNLDHTISTIPTASLLTTNVINHRKSGRQTCVIINIDVESVVYCSDELFTELANLCDYKKNMVKERDITNFDLFSCYTNKYLQTIAKPARLELSARELNLDQCALPIEINIRSIDYDWAKSTKIKTELTQHLILMLSIFKLKLLKPLKQTDLSITPIIYENE